MQLSSIWKYLPRPVFILCSGLLLLVGFKVLGELKPGKFEDLLPDGNPVKNSYLQYRKEFNVQDKIHLVLRKTAGRFSTEEITELNQHWKSELRRFPQIVNVDTLFDRKIVAVDKNEFITRKYQEETRRGFSFWENIHLGKNLDALLITVSLKKLNNQEQNQLMEKLINLTTTNSGDFQFYWVGTIVSNYFFFQEQIRLQYILCPLILLLMSVFLVFLFRNWKVGLYFAANIIVIYFILGTIIGYFEKGISPYSSFALFFTLIISTSDLIHLFYSWKGPKVFKRCLYTTVTTVVAFFTFIFNSNVSIQELGKYSGLGGIIAFLVTFYLFPFALKIWNLDIPKSVPRKLPGILPAVLSSKANSGLLWIGILALFCIPSVIIDEDPYHKFSDHHYLNQGINFLKSEFGSVGTLDLTLEFNQGELNTSVIEELNSLEKSLSTIPGITQVKSLSSLLNGTFYQENSVEKEIAFPQLKNFSRILTNFQLLDYYYNSAIKKMRLEIYVDTTSSRELTVINSQIKNHLNKSSLTQLANPQLVGFPQVMLSLYEHFKSDFFYSMGSSLLFIFICFVVMLKSFRKALVAIIPNIFPIVVTAGIIGVLCRFFHFNLESNLLVINCVVMGIAVDDSIHFLLATEDQLKINPDLELALKNANNEVGDSLKATTYVLLTAFISFLFSDIVLFAQMGVLIAFSLWLALLADLWMLPYLMLKFRRLWQK